MRLGSTCPFLYRVFQLSAQYSAMLPPITASWLAAIATPYMLPALPDTLQCHSNQQAKVGTLKCHERQHAAALRMNRIASMKECRAYLHRAAAAAARSAAALPPVFPAAVAKAARVARHARWRPRDSSPARGLARRRRCVWSALCLRFDLLPKVLQAQGGQNARTLERC